MTKETNPIILDMRQCEKDGYGVHYGWWRAAGHKRNNEAESLREYETRICKRCGKRFSMEGRNAASLYCSPECQQKMQAERHYKKMKNKKRKTNGENETVAE
jgi:hypothetical protein